MLSTYAKTGAIVVNTKYLRDYSKSRSSQPFHERKTSPQDLVSQEGLSRHQSNIFELSDPNHNQIARSVCHR